ncbi:MAG TPA: polysaccharide deacetylase family protein [Flavobacterium sp.]|nr:polysaccharide deacetylase family protein [Flavobacterium sp.]
MKPLFSFCLLLIGHLVAGQQTQTTRLIVRGDDMGYSHSGNEALIECYKGGIQKTIEVIVPSPWFPEAVKMLQEHPGVDVGVHLTLTSEWDNVKWRPLTKAASLTDENGYFRPMIWPNPNYPGKALLENHWDLRDIEAEFRAQIEMAKRLIPQVSHISSHMWCTEMTPEVKAMAKRLAKEYQIDIDLDELGIGTFRYDGPSGTPKEKITSFLSALSKLEPGKTYMFLDHPGHDDPELRAIHHIGYENVAVDRAGVTQLFLSPEVRKFLSDKHIELISYADLRSRP